MVDDLLIGRVGPARGVRGDVFVEPFTDAPDERFAPDVVLRTDPATAGPLRVEASAWSGTRLVLRFHSVCDRAGAEALRGVRLVIDAADRPALDDPDEFYDTDLVGLRARTVDGVEFGPVRDVVHAGGVEYLVIEVAGAERLVPFVSAIVPTVDVAAGLVEIDPPPGLFEL